MITQTFNLNMIPDQFPVVVYCDQYDVGEGRLKIHLYENKIAYTPSAGATAIIQGKKPDGKGFMYDATISGNVVTADLTAQMSIIAGDVLCQIVITETDDRTGTYSFFLRVQPSALPADTDMSASEYQVVEELMETAQAINTNLPYPSSTAPYNWYVYNTETKQYEDSGVSSRGAAAGFGTPTASVDSNVGTPSVSASGPDTAKVFTFEFHNLKGEAGASATMTYDSEEELLTFNSNA